jgi:hypothetical protein
MSNLLNRNYFQKKIFKNSNSYLQLIIVMLILGVILNYSTNFSLWSTIILGTSIIISVYILKKLNIKI